VTLLTLLAGKTRYLFLLLTEQHFRKILQAFTSVAEFWLEGAWNSEEAELVSPRRELVVPLEFAVPACTRPCFPITPLNQNLSSSYSCWER
jgi:hypothetical protein